LFTATIRARPYLVDISGYVSAKCRLINDNRTPVEQQEPPTYSDDDDDDADDGNNGTASVVVKSVPVYVHPEGIPRQTTDSAYFCANGDRRPIS